jgi:hypothetical protein
MRLRKSELLLFAGQLGLLKAIKANTKGKTWKKMRGK